jgi:hypothetical protein
MKTNTHPEKRSKEIEKERTLRPSDRPFELP